jgi:hypothetical protein
MDGSKPARPPAALSSPAAGRPSAAAVPIPELSSAAAEMSTARLWRDHGKRQQAYELLAPIHGWFIEGFDTLDLKEVKALLVDLA